MTESTPALPHRLRWVVIALLAGLALFVVTGCAGDDGGAGPEQPTFDFVIPADAGERIAAGEPLEILPAELVAELNETIQIVNEDDESHQVGPWFLGPGETLRQRFTTAGVFSGACSVHPSGAFSITVRG